MAVLSGMRLLLNGKKVRIRWSGSQHVQASGEQKIAAGGTVNPNGRREDAAQPRGEAGEIQRRGIPRQSGALPAIQRSGLRVVDWFGRRWLVSDGDPDWASKSPPRRGAR